MLKQLVNECVIDLAIRPDGPILIKSGIETVSGPDMAFVRTWRDGEQQVFLPGSSLKGVLRSHAERIARTFGEAKACDPFSKSGPTMFCGRRFEVRRKWRKNERNQYRLEHDEEKYFEETWRGHPVDKLKEQVPTPWVYSSSCPICRLFGSTWYGGRLATADAYAEGRLPGTEQRDGVGIDRFTGGAARGAKFELEVVTSGTFLTTIHIRNFELWQLGLVGFLLQDLKDGLIRVGMGKSRGLGKVRGEVRSIRVDFLGPQAPEPQDGQLALKGVGSLIPEEMAQAYGMVQPDEVTVPFAGEWKGGPGHIRHTAYFTDQAFPWAELGQRWVAYIKAYETPPEMAPERFVGGA